jgi:hypothetical protein
MTEQAQPTSTTEEATARSAPSSEAPPPASVGSPTPVLKVFDAGEVEWGDLYVSLEDFDKVQKELVASKAQLTTREHLYKEQWERAEKAEFLNGLQAANIKQLAAELDEAEQSLAALLAKSTGDTP